MVFVKFNLMGSKPGSIQILVWIQMMILMVLTRSQEVERVIDIRCKKLPAVFLTLILCQDYDFYLPAIFSHLLLPAFHQELVHFLALLMVCFERCFLFSRQLIPGSCSSFHLFNINIQLSTQLSSLQAAYSKQLLQLSSIQY